MNQKFKLEERMPMVTTPTQTHYSDKQFLHTITAAVTLPLAQALVISAALMIATATIIFAFDGYSYAKPIVIVGALSFVITLITLIGRWITLTRLEELTKLDLNRDNKVGNKPIEHKIHVQVDEVREGHIGVSKLFDLDGIAPGQLKALAIGNIDQRKGWAETEWSPLNQGLPFSLDQIRYLKRELIKRGLLIEIVKGKKVIGYTETAMLKSTLRKWKDIDETDE